LREIVIEHIYMVNIKTKSLIMIKLLVLLVINIYAAEEVLWDTKISAIVTIGYDEMDSAVDPTSKVVERDDKMVGDPNPLIQVLKQYNDEDHNNLWECKKEVVAEAVHKLPSLEEHDYAKDFFTLCKKESDLYLEYCCCIPGDVIIRERKLPPSTVPFSQCLAQSDFPSRYIFKLSSEAHRLAEDLYLESTLRERETVRIAGDKRGLCSMYV